MFIDHYCRLASGQTSDCASLSHSFWACLYGLPELDANSLGVGWGVGVAITSQTALG